jgi:AcrR family transcriptional regulator
MPRQSPTRPRKRPRQQRSKATVDAILGATTRILLKHGFDGLTTNAVAAAAGVSIGSLYQYFPNKEALVTALVEREVQHIDRLLLAEMTLVSRLPVGDAVRRLVELSIRGAGSDPALRPLLLEHVRRAGRIAKLREMDELRQRMVAGLLASRRGELDLRDPDLSAFVLVSTIEAVVQRAELLYPERLRDARLADELALLIARYLGVRG